MLSNEKRLLFILAAVQFCHIIDFMIVMPLGKKIMGVFDITPGQFSWVVSAYAGAALLGNLVSTAFVDRFDRRAALLFLFTGFSCGTLACAFAPDYLTLLLFRALAGAFGGTLGALVFAIVGDVIPLERRASAMGWVMTAFSAASVVGVPSGIWIASAYGWNAPFMATAALSLAFLGLSFFFVPSLRGHLAGGAAPVRSGPGRHRRLAAAWQPFVNIFTDPNQRAALLFTFSLMLGHFTIIPFIAPYMQINVGFADRDVALIYLVGGSLTVVLLPLVGKLSDRYGRMRIFSLASVLALFSIYGLTNLATHSVPLGLLVTSSFFVVASGRSVPATTMITAVVRPESRGGFMSIRQSVNELALFLSSLVAGFIITEGPDGFLQGYSLLGYFTMGMSLVAVYAASRVRAIA